MDEASARLAFIVSLLSCVSWSMASDLRFLARCFLALSAPALGAMPSPTSTSSNGASIAADGRAELVSGKKASSRSSNIGGGGSSGSSCDAKLLSAPSRGTSSVVKAGRGISTSGAALRR
eukprot:1968373-Pleurochrysis_carterae.AAC.1